jgi:hypothetical protein
LDNPANPDSPTERLKALFLGRLRRFEERRFARRVCDEALAALGAVRAQRPELRNDALYEAIIARRLQVDPNAARLYMQRVRDSNEDWDTDRTPKFIDVVKYMIVGEYLAQEPGATGMVLDLGAFLVERIDPKV